MIVALHKRNVLLNYAQNLSLFHNYFRWSRRRSMEDSWMHCDWNNGTSDCGHSDLLVGFGHSDLLVGFHGDGWNSVVKSQKICVYHTKKVTNSRFRNKEISPLLLPANEVWGKVMFLNLSVSYSVHRVFVLCHFLSSCLVQCSF